MRGQTADRNARLARENSALKASLSSNLDEQEHLLKRCIKSEYFCTLAHRQAIEAVDESMRCLEASLLVCQKAKAALEAQHRLAGRGSVPAEKKHPLRFADE